MLLKFLAIVICFFGIQSHATTPEMDPEMLRELGIPESCLAGKDGCVVHDASKSRTPEREEVLEKLRKNQWRLIGYDSYDTNQDSGYYNRYIGDEMAPWNKESSSDLSFILHKGFHPHYLDDPYYPELLDFSADNSKVTFDGSIESEYQVISPLNKEGVELTLITYLDRENPQATDLNNAGAHISGTVTFIASGARMHISTPYYNKTPYRRTWIFIAVED